MKEIEVKYKTEMAHAERRKLIALILSLSFRGFAGVEVTENFTTN